MTAGAPATVAPVRRRPLLALALALISIVGVRHRSSGRRPSGNRPAMATSAAKARLYPDELPQAATATLGSRSPAMSRSALAGTRSGPSVKPQPMSTSNQPIGFAGRRQATNTPAPP